MCQIKGEEKEEKKRGEETSEKGEELEGKDQGAYK